MKSDQPIEVARITSGNASLDVKLYERPGAETIIFLHGGPGVPDEMTEVREILCQTMQVITFDQRGTGIHRCGKCTYTIPDYLEDINKIASQFKLSRFHLLGHSWGGLYAQLYAAAYPEKILSLFLCSPALGSGKKIWKMTEQEVFHYNRSRSTTAEWLAMGVNVLLGKLGSSRACQRLFRQVIINYHKGFGADPPDEDKLAKIQADPVNKTRQNIMKQEPLKQFGPTPYPVIITYGDQDVYGQSKNISRERFPQARYQIIPRSGHTPWKHNLPAFAEILQSFYKT